MKKVFAHLPFSGILFIYTTRFLLTFYSLGTFIFTQAQQAKEQLLDAIDSKANNYQQVANIPTTFFYSPNPFNKPRKNAQKGLDRILNTKLY